jgi:hypothetical protein
MNSGWTKGRPKPPLELVHSLSLLVVGRRQDPQERTVCHGHDPQEPLFRVGQTEQEIVGGVLVHILNGLD